MDQAGASKPTFLWRGILILLPLFLLAGLGLFSLRQDQVLADIEARRQCQSMAEHYVEGMTAGLLGALTHFPGVIHLDSQGHLRTIDLSQDRAIIPRDPFPKPLPVALLSSMQTGAWRDAQGAEYGDTNAIFKWKKFIELAPPSPFLIQAKYNLALSQARHGERPAADQLFAEVQSNRTVETESGLPLWLLAEFQRVQTSGVSVDDIYRDLVDHPTFATPIMLQQLSEVHPSPKWMDVWQRDESARDFYLHIRAPLTADTNAWFWTFWQGKEWLVGRYLANRGGVALGAATNERVISSFQWILRDRFGQPSYAEVKVDVAQRPIIDADSRWPVLARASNDCVVVSEVLSRPDILYAQQRKRTAWFAGLIVVSAVAATIGFVSAYRGFHQLLRLAEMKSNFVSSVSHELRAPIASMRLMSESLERGKIVDTAKQQEYFGFLVQESRRLSSLIENILDFSRIEQGRKIYHFESTDLDALAGQTVRLMAPCAAERGVELQRRKMEQNGTAVISCDALAVQQALINLIDNAIKHAPGGTVVMVGSDAGNGQVQLWVEDQGAGIPAEEHEKIFERFYRRGSELRRETQGIGIGLTIVKHTAEAHGGKVAVRSAPGQGSRFTIELPITQNGSETR